MLSISDQDGVNAYSFRNLDLLKLRRSKRICVVFRRYLWLWSLSHVTTKAISFRYEYLPIQTVLASSTIYTSSPALNCLPGLNQNLSITC